MGYKTPMQFHLPNGLQCPDWTNMYYLSEICATSSQEIHVRLKNAIPWHVVLSIT